MVASDIMKGNVSLAIPFYNEEEVINLVIHDLFRSLSKESFTWELILINNGSTDRTEALITELVKLDRRINKITVPVNKGYGYGIQQGLNSAKHDLIGFMSGDGQISSADVVATLRKAVSTENTLVKIHRYKRTDGVYRLWISKIFNVIFRLLFPGSPPDINGHPKIFPRRLYETLPWKSNDWFLDSDIVLWARESGLKFDNIKVIFSERKGGKSHINLLDNIEFLYNILKRRILLFFMYSKLK